MLSALKHVYRVTCQVNVITDDRRDVQTKESAAGKADTVVSGVHMRLGRV